MSKKKRSLFGGILGSLLLPLGTAPAVADPGPPADSSLIDAFIAEKGHVFLARQGRLLDFKSWITDLPGLDSSGYVESVNDARNLRTELLWAGKPTPLLRRIAAEGARRGIGVSVRPRTHALPELKAAVAAVFDGVERGDWPGFEVTNVTGVSAEFDGIVVHGRRRPGAAKETPGVPGSVAGVEVRVESGSELQLAATRSADTAPYNAGGLMFSAAGKKACSTGFGITINGTPRVTTARHCKAGDWVTYDGLRPYGSYVANSGDGGGRVYSGASSALVFDGAWNTADYTKRVIGYGRLSLNDYVCTSGGNSGVHCNIKVTSMWESFNDGTGVFATLRGVHQGGQIASAKGDSGGPVITLGGTGQVYAAGMIQGGSKAVSCSGIHEWTGAFCTSDVYFSSMETIVRSLPGAALRTSG
ncbi:hypothetical protein GCM10027589_29260 [Actinocorallia lasiicapitis]